MYNESFADGSMALTGYVCILEKIPHPRPQAQIPLSLITTDKDNALRLKKDYGYEIYSIKLLKESEND